MSSAVGGFSETVRGEELAANLAHVQRRIAAACAAVSRPVDEVELIAITKTFPASDVIALAALGLIDVGESRDQEAAPKVAEVEELAALAPADFPSLRWHFVGALQTNKCASVVTYASFVHSVDRLRLVNALDRAAGQHQVRVNCLVQVDLDEVSRPGRAGARPPDVAALADAIAVHSSLELAGVMAVAPLGADPMAAFGRLTEIADAVRQRHPAAGIISAGMSGDLEAAVANGATHLRVGSALLGSRRHPVG
ncbi:MAG TPA: YggS family pyridoxal phosphate-dependent enzyme [Acidothermaceae bacterium]|jgi:pyridoxal phosphate enzyme (YggS family)|nr:YggS family pyridoxal phosphate-dependent enzyme [Acidothermaceae bacterium]